jgi:hypothetical protein
MSFAVTGYENATCEIQAIRAENVHLQRQVSWSALCVIKMLPF